MLKTTDIKTEMRPFWKVFDRVCYRHNYSQVFSDFVDMAMTQFFPPEDQGAKDLHSQAISRYSVEEKALLSEAYHEFLKCWIQSTEGNPSYDFFGDLYQTISSNFKSSAMGQFFTPEHLCDMMSLMIGSVKGGTVNDPACGSGRMIISHHAKYRDDECIYVAEDLDPICAKMTAINMCLHGIRGEVLCHDSLMELDKFRFCIHVNSLLQYRVMSIPHMIHVREGSSLYIGMNKRRLERIQSEGKTKEEATIQVNEELNSRSGEQLNLFLKNDYIYNLPPTINDAIFIPIR